MKTLETITNNPSKKEIDLEYGDSITEDRTCANCEHANKANHKAPGVCPVLQKKIIADQRCLAWNNGDIENTWYLILQPSKQDVYVLVREIESDTATDIVATQFRLPVKNEEESVIDILKDATREKGCPDVLVFLSGDRMDSGKLHDHCGYYGIKFRKLTPEGMTVPLQEGQDPLDVLSDALYAYLGNLEGDDNVSE